MGYPDESPDLKKRLPLEAVVHRNQYRLPSDDDIRRWYKEHDQEWELLSESRRKEFSEQGIDGIAQQYAAQKFSAQNVEKRSRGILKNLRASGFDLSTGK